MDEREEGDVLGPQDLVQYHKLDPHLPRNGIKSSEPDGSTEQAIRLSEMQAQQREMLDEKRVAKSGSLSIGEWNQDLELIEVRTEKGKFWQTMGYNAGNKKYLYPEEGLFLMEMNAFEIWFEGVPLSLQQAYELLIPKEFSLEEFQTFGYLMRLGYIVTRHRQCDITEYEHRIKLYRQNSSRRQRSCKKVQVWFDQIAKKISKPNTSDSGDLTDESYYSSSSGNGFSLNSAGDLNSKVKQAQQDLDERCLSEECCGGLDENSSVYSDGPVAQLSVENLERVDSDFNYSVVNLLDYHQRHFSSGSEHNHKVLKRKQTSWYIATSNGSTSGSSIREISMAKVRKESHNVSKGFEKCQEKGVSDHIIEEGTSKKSAQTGKMDLQSSDLGISEPSVCDSSIDIDEFLMTMVQQIKNVKKKSQKSKNFMRPYSTWNFAKIHIPDMGFQVLDPKFGEVPIKKPPMGKKPKMVPKESKGKEETVQSGVDGNGGGVIGVTNRTRGVHTSESDRDLWISAMLDKGDKLLNSRVAAPSNWMEYKALMKEAEKDLTELLVSPVGNLWSGEVKPLVKPSDAVDTGKFLGSQDW